MYTCVASFILNHDVEFDWVGMEEEGLIIIDIGIGGRKRAG